jgi:hypothetical protein
MQIGKPQKVVPHPRELIPCLRSLWSTVVTLPVGEPLVVVRADDRYIAVVLLPGDVMLLQCHKVRLSAGNTTWMLRSEAP